MSRQANLNPWAARIAMTGLLLWGLVHIAGGLSLLVAGTVDGLETLGPNATDSVPATPGDTAAGLLRFHSLNIAIGGIAVTGLVVTWWRRRTRWQLDVALAVAAALDIGLVAYLVIPGILPASQGLIGPVLVAISAGAAFQARTGTSLAVHHT